MVNDHSLLFKTRIESGAQPGRGGGGGVLGCLDPSLKKQNKKVNREKTAKQAEWIIVSHSTLEPTFSVNSSREMRKKEGKFGV